MFDYQTSIHPRLDTACRRFSLAHNLTEVAAVMGMSAQVLRNKLNPDQPHWLTTVQATGKATLPASARAQVGNQSVNVCQLMFDTLGVVKQLTAVHTHCNTGTQLNALAVTGTCTKATT